MATSSIAGPPAPKLDKGEFEGPVHPFPGDWESWDAYFTFPGGEHIGFSHVVAEAVSDETGSDIRYHVEDQLAIRRGKAIVTQRLTHTSTESVTGRLLDFEGELRVGPAVTRFDGTMDNGKLVVTTVRGASRTTRRLPWSATSRGLVAVQQSLHRKPIEAGESRTLMMLLPIRHEIATVRLHCSGMAAVPMIDGKHRQLLEVNSQIEVDEEVVALSVMWVDEEGQTLRSYTPALRMVAYRTDEDTAITTDIPAIESVGAAAIEVSGKLERPGDAVRVAYVVLPVGAGSSEVKIDAAPDQFVRVRPDGSIQVLVSRKGDKSIRGFEGFDLEPAAGDRDPSPLIDFKSPLVVRIADVATVTRDLSDREVAMQLAMTVNSLISPREFSGGFSRASEVVLDAAGDCTDHAILLAALLRARGIPSRLAIGLRYVSGDPATMVYHMWTLGYLEDEWVPLDAITGGLAAADRITLATTDLSEGNKYDSAVAALGALGMIEVNVSGAEY